MDPASLTAEAVAAQLTSYMHAAQAAREKANPALRNIHSLTDEELVSALPCFISVI